MKEVVVISGKGGTGKTSIVASLAALAEMPVLADCDVDAADLHLVLSPVIMQEHEFSGGKRARINKTECFGCGKCEKLCRFDAISLTGPANDVIGKTYAVDPIACEGCGVCAWFCPAKAIEFKEAINGRWFVSQTRFGPMVHAKLGMAEENSGKLVTTVRKKARQIAEDVDARFILIDGSPGIGCPVIASITGADLVLIVTEPTLSGQHDLRRVADLARHFNIPAAVCINKCDLNEDISQAIEQEAKERNLFVAGKICYDKDVTKAQIMKKSVVEYGSSPTAQQIRQMWHNLVDRLGMI